MQPEQLPPHNNQPLLNNSLENSSPPQEIPVGPKPHNPSWWRNNLSTILIILAAPLTAWLIVSFVARSYIVDGPSMLTTLHDKDRLIINKIPKTFSSLAGKKYIPERYQIIVFQHDGQFSGEPDTKKNVIKRVIGVPGDRVVIKDGVVKIFNSEHPDGFLVDQLGPEASVIGATEPNVDVTVKDGEVFVLGDNRSNSLDSREMGTIPSRDIVGKLSYRIWPLDVAQRF